MEQQQKEKRTGMTYESGITLKITDTIPDYINKAETDKKRLWKIECPFFCYFIKEHKVSKA